MPLKPFLTSFARLLLVALVVLLLCVGLFSGINQIRQSHWLETFSEPVMGWLASVPSPLERYGWLESRFHFSVLPLERASNNGVLQERLAYGQVVADRHALGVRLRKKMDDGRVLQGSFRDVYHGLSRLTGLLVVSHLNQQEAGVRRDTMAALGAHLGVLLSPVETVDTLPESGVLERLERRGLAIAQPSSDASAVVFARLADGELIEMRMPPPFDPWGWPVMLTLLLVAIALTAAALYGFLRQLDSNLRGVESVAVRIARGELDARVEEGQNALVRRLATAFNGMAEHIQRLVSVQREMIHAVSHELRTPVARIRFGVQMLEDCPSDSALAKQTAAIDGDIQELDELIDEILTYARLEQGGPVMAFQKTDIPAIVDRVIDEQKGLHPNHQFELDCDQPSRQAATAEAEPRYIHRAVQNLVGNAARYAASRIRVRCRIDDQTCRIDVEDDGPGIPEEDWDKVFTAFARLDDSRTRESGGYGLGLSIVRRILYWHGGQAFVSRSEELGGAAFTLVMPRRQSVRGGS